MHTVIIVSSGLAALFVFVLVAHLINRGRSTAPIDGARVFIWAWLLASLVNLAVGVFHAGVPLTTELVVLIPVFGIPAGVAWFVSNRLRRGGRAHGTPSSS